MKEPTIIYADCTGLGEVDRDLDSFVSEKILPDYTNVHNDSFLFQRHVIIDQTDLLI